MASSPALIQFLQSQGAASSAEIQATLNISQPTASRLLKQLENEVVICGQGKRTRYALAVPIGQAAAQQPIWRTDETGAAECIGTLSWLAHSQIHVQADGFDAFFQAHSQALLPWYLSPLRAQGFLGRVLAQQLNALGIPANPEAWDTPFALMAALQTHDAPGALLLGTDSAATPPLPSRLPADNPAPVLDALAANVAQTLPVGSSAAGEQPKFLALNSQQEPVLVKFSPPVGTPYGERWHDLLCAEVLCAQVLQAHGFAVAQSHIVQSDSRTYLISQRVDRVGPRGRRHMVSIGAAHLGFVKEAYVNWAATADALARRDKLGAPDTKQLHALLQFGRLIGNTDMHSGNASLFVAGTSLKEIAQGTFRLAPVYDMLPMRWKPDLMLGMPDYAPFDVDLSRVDPSTRAIAQDFWQRLSAESLVSAALQAVAKAMAKRL
jgi:DNA-binding Lrp family transcriptional regulator